LATGARERLWGLLATIAIAIFLLIPTIFKGSLEGYEKWLISRPLSLGLDLRGGVHLVYEVVVEEAVASNLRTTASNIRAALRKDKIAVLTSRVNEQGKIEVSFPNLAVGEKGKKYIDDNYKLLQSEGQTSDSGSTKYLFSLFPQEVERIKLATVDQALETIRARVDQYGVAEPLLQKQGTQRILLQMPGVTDVEKVKSLVGKVAKLEFRVVRGMGGNGPTLKDRQGASVAVSDEIAMTGDMVETASISLGSGPIEVLLSFSRDGARMFKQITTENVGKQLAIILDSTVYSAPNIREPIGGGKASISGGFTIEEAQQLSVVLKAGALPAPLTIAEERTVGPTLGSESIRKGVIAITVGFVAIGIFLIWYYQKSGVLALSTLFLNVFLMVAALALFGATLTLPGLAGLALTVGMAVDSNVIIYERIRDELRAGASRDAAIAGGFDKAFSAITDTNVTGLLTGLILYVLGTGPIRGFAVTLSLGVLTTLFCAIFVARLGFDLFPLKGRDRLSI
jgi:preprotein translocase subunit SecD